MVHTGPGRGQQTTGWRRAVPRIVAVRYRAAMSPQDDAAADRTVRVADVADAPAAAQLLHDFNTEYHDVTPGRARLAERIRHLLDGGDTVLLLAGRRPVGVAVLRFRQALWSDGLECHLAELYVAPPHRGRGVGRALLGGAMDIARRRGADRMDLGTSEDDVTARRLYESMGFINREGGPEGPISFVYERDL